MKTVKEFRDWWIANGKPIQIPFKNSIYTTDKVHVICIFRQGLYQVELVTIKPDTEIPTHTHKGVDNSVIFLGGNVEYAFGDDPYKDTQQWQKENPETGLHMLAYSEVPNVDENIPHKVRTYAQGGCFLGFEKWDTEPTSVLVNWIGEPIDETHRKLINVK